MHTLVGLTLTLVRSVELVSTLFFAERHPKASAIQNFRHKLQTITSEFDEDSLPRRVLFFRCRIRSAGRYPKMPAQSIVQYAATMRRKDLKRGDVSPEQESRENKDVSQACVIPSILTKSPDHVRKTVGRRRDASRQIKKWSLTSLRRSLGFAAKSKAPNPRSQAADMSW